MLARTYRITDKVGIALLKTSVLVVSTAAVGAASASGVLRAILLRIGQVLLWIARLLWRVLTLIFGVLRGIVGFAAGLFVSGARTVGRTGGRTARTAASAAGGAAETAMARRAARAEMQAAVAEDPLRVQNRLLSGMTFVLMVGLLVVIVWATNPARQVGVTLPAAGGSLPGLVAAPQTPSPGAPIIATVIPTATELPASLQARGSLAYVVRERAQTDLWVVNVGSRQPIRITNDPADERDPAWSPDGTQLAYASRTRGNWDIYIYNLLSGETLRLTYGLEFNGNPVWSPDGVLIAYESYIDGNLDLYAIPADASTGPIRLTTDPSPDYDPAWSPSGREIAYVSWRGGNQDVYVLNLDNPASTENPDLQAVNLTNTPLRYERGPSWSPDGSVLAYYALDLGAEKVFIHPRDPNQPDTLFALGRTPAWSPDGSSIIYAVDSESTTQLLAAPYTEGGVSTVALQVPYGATDPSWGVEPLPVGLINSGGVGPAISGDLYIEQVEAGQGDPPYSLIPLRNVNPSPAVLNERVNDSFEALRLAVAERAGSDFLGTLEYVFWDINRPADPLVPRRNWLMTGRAFALLNDSILGFPPQIEVVREDLGVETYWRLFLRVDSEAQAGQLGEPLRMMPWDFAARDVGDVQAYEQGGRVRREMPEGYYIDLTQLAWDYGWDRVSAGDTWRSNVNVINWWLFYRSEGLDWLGAMRELYTAAQLGGFMPTATPATGGG